METLQVEIGWLLSVKPYTSGSLFIVYKCMVGLKHFQNKAHSNMCMRPKESVSTTGWFCFAAWSPAKSLARDG